MTKPWTKSATDVTETLMTTQSLSDRLLKNKIENKYLYQLKKRNFWGGY